MAYFFGPRWLGKQKFLGPRTCIIQKYVRAWPARGPTLNNQLNPTQVMTPTQHEIILCYWDESDVSPH